MFKIGDFSTIARVSVHLLRHYDEIGLFKPAHVDAQSGYRYYGIDQLPELNRILALRDLGFPLEQIRRMITDDISLDELKGMLARRKTELEGEIELEQSRLRRVAARLEQIQQHGTAPRYEPIVKPIPAMPFLSIREPIADIRRSGWLYYQVSEAVIEANIASLSHPMAVFHDPYFRHHETDFEFGFLLEEPLDVTVDLPEGRTLTVKDLEPIESALTCVHHGPWPEIQLGFAALGAWMEANRLEIRGKPREVYLKLVPPEQDEDLVVEIQIPVGPRG